MNKFTLAALFVAFATGCEQQEFQVYNYQNSSNINSSNLKYVGKYDPLSIINSIHEFTDAKTGKRCYIISRSDFVAVTQWIDTEQENGTN